MELQSTLSTTNNSLFSGISSKQIKVRKVSTKQYASIGNKFNKCDKQKKKLEKEIELLEKLKLERKRIIPASEKSGESRDEKLSRYELSSISASISEKKAELKRLNPKWKSNGTSFMSANKSYANAKRKIVKMANYDAKLACQAKKRMSDLLSFATTINELIVREEGSEIVAQLEYLAKNDGTKFRSILEKYIRSKVEVTGDLKPFLKLQFVRTEIIRALRLNFGWVPVR